MSTPAKTVRHGWFSAKLVEQRIRLGDEYQTHYHSHQPQLVKRILANWYRTPKGEEVLVTWIHDSATIPPSSFEDEVYVGEVTEHLRCATDQEAKAKAGISDFKIFRELLKIEDK